MDLFDGGSVQLVAGTSVYDAEKTSYTVDKLLGRGGFGEVFRVCRQEDGQPFALKAIAVSYLDQVELRALVNEGAMAAEIDHPNVNRIRYFHDGKTYPELPPYLLMDFADGGTLQNLLAAKREAKAFFSADEMREMYFQLVDGMIAISAKLVHRDIKPDNILVHGGRLKISDFGLSKVVGAATRSQTFKEIQHIMYRAPEAWTLDKNTPQMDMYSMGIVFYQIATLRHPLSPDVKGEQVSAWRDAHFYGAVKPTTQVNSAVPGNLSEVIMKMLSKRPADRYQFWDEIKRRLTQDSGGVARSLDLGLVIQKARDSQAKKEAQKAEQARLASAGAERRKLVVHLFKEIVEAFKEITEQFNAGTDVRKLRVEPSDDHVALVVDEGVYVTADLREIHNLNMRNTEVLAWGVVKNSNKRGFNIILSKESNDDLFGVWWTHHHSWHALTRTRDIRPEPFALENEEDFRHRINIIGGTTIWETRSSPFSAAALIALLKDVL